MQGAKVLSLLAVQEHSVVDPNGTEGRHPPDAGADGISKVGRVERGPEAVDVTGVDEGDHAKAVRQGNDVLHVAQEVRGAADTGSGLVDRGDAPELDAAKGVGAAQVEALEQGKVLAAPAPPGAPLHPPRQDMAEPDRLKVARG